MGYFWQRKKYELWNMKYASSLFHNFLWFFFTLKCPWTDFTCWVPTCAFRISSLDSRLSTFASSWTLLVAFVTWFTPADLSTCHKSYKQFFSLFFESCQLFGPVANVFRLASMTMTMENIRQLSLHSNCGTVKVGWQQIKLYTNIKYNVRLHMACESSVGQDRKSLW